MKFDQTKMSEALRGVLQRMHYPLEVMLVCVRWYVAYPLSLRHLEEMMAERRVAVDHSSIHRWAINMLPVLAAVCRRRKRPVGQSWRMDETYVKVGGQWNRPVGRSKPSRAESLSIAGSRSVERRTGLRGTAS